MDSFWGGIEVVRQIWKDSTTYQLAIRARRGHMSGNTKYLGNHLGLILLNRPCALIGFRKAGTGANLSRALIERFRRDYAMWAGVAPLGIAPTRSIRECPSAINQGVQCNPPLHTCPPVCWVATRITCMLMDEGRCGQNAPATPQPDIWERSLTFHNQCCRGFLRIGAVSI